jgi:hypothetical protein
MKYSIGVCSVNVWSKLGMCNGMEVRVCIFGEVQCEDTHPNLTLQNLNSLNYQL